MSNVSDDAVTSWCYRGITLAAGPGNAGPRLGGGLVALADLERFVARVRAEMPNALIAVHEYGLRAVTSDPGTHSHRPRVDWSDWL